MKYFSLSFLLVLAYYSSAQNYVDLATLHYQTTSDNKFDSSSNKTKVDEVSLNLTLPLKINSNTAIITGLAIDRYKTDITEFGDKTTLSSYLLKAGINTNHSEKWNGTYLLLPKLASDFKEKKEDNFQLGAVGLWKYQKNPNMRYKIGLYYNGDKFGTFFVPLLGFYYKKNKFEADLTLPSSADANYRIKKNMMLGMHFRAIVKSFNLTQSYQSLGSEYIEQNSNEIMAYLGYEITKGLIIKGQIGYSIGRSYGLYGAQAQMDFGISAFKFGDNRTQLNSDFADGLLFRFQMLYRVYLE